MASGAAQIWISLPAEHSKEMREIWRSIRIASAMSAEADLSDPDISKKFDANTIAEWVMPLTEVAKVMIPAIFGYLVARRGEMRVGSYVFKNMSASDIDEVLKILKKHNINDSSN